MIKLFRNIFIALLPYTIILSVLCANRSEKGMVLNNLSTEMSTINKEISLKIHIAKCCPYGAIFAVQEINDMIKLICEESVEVLANEYPVYTLDTNKEVIKTGKYFKDVFELVATVLTKKFQENPENFELQMNDIKYDLYLLENGKLLFSIQEPFELKYYERDEYCIDLINDRTDILLFYIYIAETNPITKVIVRTATMLVSCLFMVLLLVIYALLPEFRNLHDLVLMSYVSSLLAAFTLYCTLGILILVKLNPVIVCQTLSYTSYFFILSSFLWMNVISFDTWYTFRGLLTFHNQHSRPRTHYKLYCAYAWGVPLVMTVLVSLLDDVLEENSWLRPDIKHHAFFSGTPKLLYLSVPMSIVMGINLLFFVLTLLNVWRQSRNNSTQLRSTISSPTDSQLKRVKIYVQLFVLMGLTWIMEIISQECSEKWQIWFELCNGFQGIYIFFIFVYKKKTWRVLVKRFTNDSTTSNWYISSETQRDCSDT